MNKISLIWEVRIRQILMQLLRIILLPIWFIYHLINQILIDLYGDEK